jgi:hypothetical protein
MAAGLGFKTFTTGEVLTAGDVNGYLMQGINVFASSAARASAITSPQEGQYSYLKDTNSTEYYDGAAWIAAPIGDITGVTAGTGISGGGTSGTVTVTNSMATAIDAKGDLIAGTAADTFDRLAVGANDTVLTADSTAATGLKWAAAAASGTAYAAGKNGVLNSAMNVWQRGTSISLAASTAYTSGFLADRWQTSTAANQATTVSRQATGDTTNLPDIQYAMRFQRNSGQTGTTGYSITQSFETINSVPFAGKTVTMSFYARAGATAISSGATTVTQFLYTGTGTDQNIFAGFTGSATPINSAKTLTATWQRFTTSATLASTTTQIAPVFVWTPIGTAGATDYIEITGVQVEIASSASAFMPNGSTYAAELASCMRYFQRMGNESNMAMATGGAVSSTGTNLFVKHVVTMRTAPTFSFLGSLSTDVLVLNGSGGVAGNATGLTAGPLGTTQSRIDTSGGSGLTAGQVAAIQCSNTSPSISFSAEL